MLPPSPQKFGEMMPNLLKSEPSDMARLNEQFAKTGLIAVTSISIVRDCARLLLDLYRTGIHLQLLTVLKGREKALEALHLVGLQGREHHTPGELSGGQQQRVAIARAIVTDPLLLLADEPTGNLDTARSREIMELIASLNEERGITVVMVTHEAEMAAYAHRVIRFTDGLIASDEAKVAA